jgi:hypothetical protein
MFEPFVIQPTYVEKNARELAYAVLGKTTGDARTLLHKALNEIQPDKYTWSTGASGPVIQFNRYDGLQEAVLRRIMVVDELPPDWELESAIRPECKQKVRLALQTLADIDPEIHRSVTMVVASVIFGRLKNFGGGSNSSAIGCVWLNPKSSWTEVDWLENLFHEYIHQCLFIDDMRHGLFTTDGMGLAEEKALVQSAILCKLRPYDRAFHSAFVSFGLIQLDIKINALDRINCSIPPLRITLNELLSKPQFLTPHGLLVLKSLFAAFEALQVPSSAGRLPC